MRILILGGTAFLGRSLAEHARDSGHQVTCAARGESGSPVAGVEFVRVDREAPDGLAALEGRDFDEVVDLARPQSHVRRALAALAERAAHWTYVSSMSVYADEKTPAQRADTATLLPPAPDDEWRSPTGYGGNKVAAERAVLAAAGDRAFNCRAGLIVGPGDDSGRFGYWVRRLADAADGEEVLAPGRPTEPMQVIDVRDLNDWILRAAADGLTGTYDGVGPVASMEQLLTGIAAGVGTTPRFTWVDGDFLAEQGVQPWMGKRSLPLWAPITAYWDVTASLEAGLVVRDVADTARATLDAEAPLNARYDAAPGITRDDEATLLRAWHARSR